MGLEEPQEREEAWPCLGWVPISGISMKLLKEMNVCLVSTSPCKLSRDRGQSASASQMESGAPWVLGGWLWESAIYHVPTRGGGQHHKKGHTVPSTLGGSVSLQKRVRPDLDLCCGVRREVTNGQVHLRAHKQRHCPSEGPSPSPCNQHSLRVV